MRPRCRRSPGPPPSCPCRCRTPSGRGRPGPRRSPRADGRGGRSGGGGGKESGPDWTPLGKTGVAGWKTGGETCPPARLARGGGGRTNDDISGRLQLSRHTVKTHVNRAMTKIGVSERAQLVTIA
ncbi:response regulator transcription factor, partial [Streptomyces scabiei]|uniref:response regulator transcription factor n=1 Tax=Streptomyces scabiei TaxID=1930 RepID=UPI003977515F